MPDITVDVTKNESTGEPELCLQIDGALYRMAVAEGERLRDDLSKVIEDALGELGPATTHTPEITPGQRLWEREPGPSLFHE